MKASKVVSSVIYNYLGVAFVTITGFAYTAFIVHRMSHARFGILVLTSSLITYSNVLDLGIGVRASPPSPSSPVPQQKLY